MRGGHGHGQPLGVSSLLPPVGLRTECTRVISFYEIYKCLSHLALIFLRICMLLNNVYCYWRRREGELQGTCLLCSLTFQDGHGCPAGRTGPCTVGLLSSLELSLGAWSVQTLLRLSQRALVRKPCSGGLSDNHAPTNTFQANWVLLNPEPWGEDQLYMWRKGDLPTL